MIVNVPAALQNPAYKPSHGFPLLQISGSLALRGRRVGDDGAQAEHVGKPSQLSEHLAASCREPQPLSVPRMQRAACFVSAHTQNRLCVRLFQSYAYCVKLSSQPEHELDRTTVYRRQSVNQTASRVSISTCDGERHENQPDENPLFSG